MSGLAVDASGIYVSGNDDNVGFLNKYSKDGAAAWGTSLGWLSNPHLASDATSLYSHGWARYRPIYFTYDLFTKYDASGTPLWSSHIATRNGEAGNALAVAANSAGAYAGGWGWPVDIPDYPYESFRPWVRKYSPAGTYAWQHVFGSTANDRTNALGVDDTGAYAVGVVNGSNGFVYKYATDSTGTPVWAREFALTDSGWTMGTGVCADASGLYAVGQVSPASQPGNTFVRKYDKEGTEVWTHQFASNDDAVGTFAYAAACDGTGVYVAGTTGGAFPGYNKSGYQDLFLRKYDPEGNEIWTFQFGTGEALYDSVAIAVDDSAVYVASTSEPNGLVVKLIKEQIFPKLMLPENQTAEATGPSGAAVNFTTSATDFAGASVDVSCVPVSGSTFPLGTTTVDCSATDTHNIKAEGSFTVTVVDTTRPNLTLPANMSKEATSATGAAVTYSASAIDLVDGSVAVSCVPGSGSTFPLDTTTVVTCSATDAHNNTAQGSFTVRVVDTTPPSLTLPANIPAIAAFALGAFVTYSGASATDLVSGSVPVSCSPASGRLFGPGSTTVNCSATDAHNNKGQGGFTVTVTFAWSGFLRPINPDGSSVFKRGSTVPVKFQLTGRSAGIVALVARLYVARVSNGIVGDYARAQSNSNIGNFFRYDWAARQYIFDWETKSVSSTGTYQLKAEFGDDVVRTVTVSLKK
ncbi:MAG: HYR domain-containing protein [Acidobacteriia bacterium]|nr:HYR domain-containing protein [Terriglobia bacterium]